MVLKDLSLSETIHEIEEILRSLTPGDYERKSFSFEKIKTRLESQLEIVRTGDFPLIEESVRSTSRWLADSFDWDDPLFPLASNVNALANHLVRRWRRGESEYKP
jgi:hypothetical protein